MPTKIISLVQDRLSREILAFQSLTPQGRVLLLCYQLLAFASPFIGVFLSLYIWRQTNDVHLVIFYNLFLYAFIPLGFIANG